MLNKEFFWEEIVLCVTDLFFSTEIVITKLIYIQFIQLYGRYSLNKRKS